METIVHQRKFTGPPDVVITPYCENLQVLLPEFECFH
jgi:hypothetical protein